MSLDYVLQGIQPLRKEIVMEPLFRTETIYDLPVHQEFKKSFQYASRRRSVANIIGCFLVIWYISLFHMKNIIFIYLALVAYLLIVYLVRNSKNGDINYKRILQSNGGEPMHEQYRFYEDSIHVQNVKNGNQHHYSYEIFRHVINAPHMLILVMEHRSCLILEKPWLKGGSPDELLQFLLHRCSNLKSKRAKGIGFGKFTYRLVAIFLAVGTAIALYNLCGIQTANWLKNDMTYAEMAEQLRPLGIVISDKTIEEMISYDEEYQTEFGEDYYYGDANNRKVIDLLYWEGVGVYDSQTSEWTPSASGIFWFDMEVWNAGAIYSDFFRGLRAMHPDLNFTNVQEDYSRVDIEAGTGTVGLSFDLNGAHYEMDANYYYDWYDESVLTQILGILCMDDSTENLYYANDGQAIFLYYGSADQVKQLEQKTGLDFSDSY